MCGTECVGGRSARTCFFPDRPFTVGANLEPKPAGLPGRVSAGRRGNRLRATWLEFPGSSGSVTVPFKKVEVRALMPEQEQLS